ncbi:MAG TPA: VWA domain-containing protein [Pyrinomonadaceae bacterium]
MRATLSAVCLSTLLAISPLFVGAQTKPKSQKPNEDKKGAAQAGQKDNQQDVETIKVNTSLVTVPVIASTRDNIYVPDMRKEEFAVYEDGVKQEVAFFATVSEPFHVVLMLDTSASTQYKLSQIQRAAISFTEDLHKGDRVKVISFDDTVRDLSEFTSDRAVLQWAIRKTEPGKGTKLYDAMRMALDALKPIKGRRAIVLFTDGVDWQSDRATYAENRRMIEETGIIVYPIRYDTRAETERLARQQASGGGAAADLGDLIFGNKKSRPTTPPTFPSEKSLPIPGGQIGKTGRGIPSIRVTREPDENSSDDSSKGDSNSRGAGGAGGTGADLGYPRPRSNDSITEMLDRAYKLADDYLNEMAEKTGGRLLRADTLYSLPTAFAEIADELRTQYSLGYYPADNTRDGKYRRIQVKTTRKDTVIRARPGYRAPSGEETKKSK